MINFDPLLRHVLHCSSLRNGNFGSVCPASLIRSVCSCRVLKLHLDSASFSLMNRLQLWCSPENCDEHLHCFHHRVDCRKEFTTRSKHSLASRHKFGARTIPPWTRTTPTNKKVLRARANSALNRANRYYAIELPDIVVMQVFSHESVFSELERTVLGVDGGCSEVSVLLLVEARRPASLTAVLTSKTLHSLSKSLPSNCNMFSWKQRGHESEHVRVRATMV